jgi:hypothetical protein
MEEKTTQEKYDRFKKDLPKKPVYLSCDLSDHYYLNHFKTSTQLPYEYGCRHFITSGKGLQKLIEKPRKDVEKLLEILIDEDIIQIQNKDKLQNLLESFWYGETYEKLFNYVVDDEAIMIQNETTIQKLIVKERKLNGGVKCCFCEGIFKGECSICEQCFLYEIPPFMLEVLKEDVKIAEDGYDEYAEKRQKIMDDTENNDSIFPRT